MQHGDLIAHHIRIEAVPRLSPHQNPVARSQNSVPLRLDIDSLVPILHEQVDISRVVIRNRRFESDRQSAASLILGQNMNGVERAEGGGGLRGPAGRRPCNGYRRRQNQPSYQKGASPSPGVKPGLPDICHSLFLPRRPEKDPSYTASSVSGTWSDPLWLDSHVLTGTG